VDIVRLLMRCSVLCVPFLIFSYCKNSIQKETQVLNLRFFYFVKRLLIFLEVINILLIFATLKYMCGTSMPPLSVAFVVSAI